MSLHPWHPSYGAKAIPESPRSASSGGIATCLRAGRAARPFGKTMATPEDDAFGRPPGRGTGTKGATSGPRFHPRAGDAVSKLARRGLPRCQIAVRRVRNEKRGVTGISCSGRSFCPRSRRPRRPGGGGSTGANVPRFAHRIRSGARVSASRASSQPRSRRARGRCPASPKARASSIQPRLHSTPGRDVLVSGSV